MIMTLRLFFSQAKPVFDLFGFLPVSIKIIDKSRVQLRFSRKNLLSIWLEIQAAVSLAEKQRQQGCGSTPGGVQHSNHSNFKVRDRRFDDSTLRSEPRLQRSWLTARHWQLLQPRLGSSHTSVYLSHVSVISIMYKFLH